MDLDPEVRGKVVELIPDYKLREMASKGDSAAWLSDFENDCDKLWMTLKSKELSGDPTQQALVKSLMRTVRAVEDSGRNIK